ncbi:50S ribosomal protein L11 methyltransferase [Patescibacteria group bacterium]|nr:50S ribosomal protein L11 methyltransferase [Patescibacteria group bacterium]
MPSLFWGAIYVPTKPEIVKKMINLADVKPGEKAIDLGSGDGRLVIALAKTGIEAHGYEINPFLVRLAQKNIRKAGISDRAFIHLKTFWKEDFSKFNIVTVYGMSHIMKKLELKLRKEIKPGAKIISNSFVFPNWRYSKKEEGVYLYENKN